MAESELDRVKRGAFDNIPWDEHMDPDERLAEEFERFTFESIEDSESVVGKPYPVFFAVSRIIEEEAVELENYLEEYELEDLEDDAPRYQELKHEYLRDIVGAYFDGVSLMGWARIVKETDGRIEEHPNYNEFSLDWEQFLLERPLGDVYEEQVQVAMILQSVTKDATGIDLLELRAQEIRNKLISLKTQKIDTHPKLVGFMKYKERHAYIIERLRQEEVIAV